MKNKHEAYSYRITFNAMHNLVLNDPRKMHAHTFRVGMYVIEKQDEHPVFLNTEKMLQEYFEEYRGIRINELELFREVLPTLENMGEIFYWDLKPLFEKNGMQLVYLEIGDGPTSSFYIGEALLLGDVSNMVEEKKVEAYCSGVRKRYQRRLSGRENE